MPTQDCLKLKTLFSELLTQRSIFGAEQKNFLKTREREGVMKMKWRIEDKIEEIRELTNPFEKLIGLRKQYDAQLTVLNNANLLKKTMNGNLGIMCGEDWYELPKYEDISRFFRLNREIYLEKIKQGFTRFLLVPLAASLDVLASRFEALLLLKRNRRELNIETESGEIIPYGREVAPEVEVVVNQSLLSEEYADRLDYYPVDFSREHRLGQPKESVLNTPPFPGWNPILVEEMINIPGPDRAKDVGGRAQLDTAGKSIKKHMAVSHETPSAQDYLYAINYETQYRYERGMTPEDYLMFMITMLSEKGILVDTLTRTLLLGAYNPLKGKVPAGGFICADLRTRYNLALLDINTTSSKFGVRTVIKL